MTLHMGLNAFFPLQVQIELRVLLWRCRASIALQKDFIVHRGLPGIARK